MPKELDAAIEEVERHLDDEAWAPRADAVAAAGSLLVRCEDEATFRRVLGLIARGTTDKKWEVRKAAAGALAQATDPHAMELLERLETDDNRWVREAATRARRRAETAGGARPDPALDQILAVIDKVRPRKLSREELLELARVFGDIHYGDLASETAHELRTVVTGVEGCMSALEHRLGELGRQDNGVADLTGKLRERMRFLTRLVEDLCTYTAAPGEMAPLKVADIIKEAVDLARGRANRSSEAAAIDVQINVPNDLVVEGVRARLPLALAAIITNAMEAITGEGRITAAAESTAGGTVIVRISDTGCGMDAQQIQDALRRYSSSKRKRGGEPIAPGAAPHAGLGLPIAFRIVEREHGGRLQIDSEPGRGTRVTVELRRAGARGGAHGAA